MSEAKKFDIYFKEEGELSVDELKCPVIEYYRELLKKELEYEKFDDMHTADGLDTKCPRKL